MKNTKSTDRLQPDPNHPTVYAHSPMQDPTPSPDPFDFQATAATILVVDDSRSNRAFLRNMLHAAGYQVLNAASGEEALEVLEDPSYQDVWPDLILLDVILPGIDGFETCSRLKANPDTHDIPVVFMTSLTETTDKVKGLSLGAVDYITKPLQAEEVKARLGVHLQLRHLTKTLEQQVADRTADLQMALDNLKRMQMQLVQSEKMSALGQLVAGVAHEINNPVNCVTGNINPAQGYVKDLLELVDALLGEFSEPPEAIATLLEDLDFEFLQEDLPKVLRSMQLGADRIKEIVKSLRNFSRLDEDQKKPADIHAGLESTLMILQHRLKARPNRDAITVVRNYGQLPLVPCYASQLNQVFMNLLGNAIDAIEELYESQAPNSPAPNSPAAQATNAQTDHPEANDPNPNSYGQIVITTHCSGPWVTIQIEDNGRGVANEAQDKLFDAFFTTKPADRGTGLGLSISHHIIVDNHGGTIFYQSCSASNQAQPSSTSPHANSPGHGTCFTIHLPLQTATTEPLSPAFSPYDSLVKSPSP